MDTLNSLKENLPSCSISLVVSGTGAGRRKKQSTGILRNQNQAKNVAVETKKRTLEPLWKRRGVKEIKSLKIDPVISGDTNWASKLQDAEPLLQIVFDSEWVTQRTCFEVHSMSDVEDGVVINPPSYPPWFRAQRTGKVVPAVFPFTTETMLVSAQRAGKLPKVISKMGDLAAQYVTNLISMKKKGSRVEVLILAGRIWQGAAAINAGRRLMAQGFSVSVYIHGGYTLNIEEMEFHKAGGTIYRKMNELQASGKTFNFAIVALENQYMGRISMLPAFGQWLQTSAVVFLDPPILKCCYSTALQIACKGAYNIMNKTAIMMPCLPKPYMVDKFVDLFVTDVGLGPEYYAACGVENFDFNPNGKHDPATFIVPEPYVENKGKIYFYQDNQRVV